MAKRTVVKKVWIEPGCIVCDSCENDCPEIFDVQENSCVVRPAGLDPAALGTLSDSILTAAKGCPVEVIKLETVEEEVTVADPQTAVILGASTEPPPSEATAATGNGDNGDIAKSRAVATLSASDPRYQAMISQARIGGDNRAAWRVELDQDPQINQAQQVIASAKLSSDAPPDQRLALLASAGAYRPLAKVEDQIKSKAVPAQEKKTSRRKFSLAVATGWAMVSTATAASLLMFQDFLSPKALREPRKQWRAGRLDEFLQPMLVNERFKRTPDGGPGFFVVNLAPRENRLVAVSIVCTHLGCVPDWVKGEMKFKCPCHGSGFYIDGMNFEGPAPRPLERFAISVDADGYVVVDQSKVYRQELGEWDHPESYVAV